MSFRASGFTAKLSFVTINGSAEVSRVSADKNDEEEKKRVYEEPFSQFIESKLFSDLTYHLGSQFTIEIEYLVHTHIK